MVRAQEGELLKPVVRLAFLFYIGFMSFFIFTTLVLCFFVLLHNQSVQNHIVYILSSKKLNRYYIGYTSDIDVRMDFYNNAEARKFTAKADDWEIVFTLSCETKKQALAIEKHIKAMKSKVYVQNLIKYTDIRDKLLKKYSSVG
ncbi:GIY-YIG nuclease family protein [Flavobacterium sp. RHBU_3]|uniref:GIY-YIG nuclease family protein n=1 Tax=Flavobacterium sp. RHBU_3 TaxID=3391184 RepID=UPI003984E689